MKAIDKYVQDQIDALKASGVYRHLRILYGPQGPRAVVDARDVINLSSNNYLGLATHPRLIDAAVEATQKYGAGSGAVRTIVGTLEIHEELERKLAAFKGTDAALVFQSGFTANQAVLGTVLEEGDLVISDALNHASIIDGVRLTKAARAIYQHNDMDDLARVLAEATSPTPTSKGEFKGPYKKILIVTDGVFSMDGDIAPLDKIADLAEQYGAATMVDDAHGSGVLGDHGRGTVNHYKIAHDRWDITMGTLSKAVGVLGGYVACSQPLRELMEHKARPFLFSTSHPPAVTAATIAAIDIMASDEGETLHKQLWDKTNFFKAGLKSLGFDTGISQTPITPVIVGEESKTMQFSQALFEAGVLATGIVFPTVPRGKARVRTIVTAAHTTEDLQEALDIFEQVGKGAGVI
jgi:glycine C-acetyltransferase